VRWTLFQRRRVDRSCSREAFRNLAMAINVACCIIRGAASGRFSHEILRRIDIAPTQYSSLLPVCIVYSDRIPFLLARLCFFRHDHNGVMWCVVAVVVSLVVQYQVRALLQADRINDVPPPAIIVKLKYTIIE
jgi:hypothetical protein